MANQLIYLDESAANEQTRFRKRGWAGYGLSPIVTRPVKRSERWSVLPAYNIDGILAWHIFQGGISGARFEWFLQEEVLLRCTPFPGNNSVLIMDNASIHHTEVSFEVYFNIKSNILICGFRVFVHYVLITEFNYFTCHHTLRILILLKSSFQFLESI